MNGFRLLVFSGMAFSLTFSSMCFAADDTSAPKIDETKSHNRGISFPSIAPSSVQAPVTVPVTVPSKVDIKAPAKMTSTAKKPTKATNKTAIIVAHPKKQDKTGSNDKIAKQIPATNSKQASAAEASSSQLVGYKHSDNTAVISASLDKKGELPKYKVGDNLMVNVKALQDCNVVVFNYDSSGTLTQIFPNDFQQNGFVRANESIEIGGSDSKFDYQIAGKGGPEKIFVYAYPTGKSNPLEVALAPIAGTPFRGGEMTVDEYRKLLSNSPVFFARSVQVVAKKTAQNVSSQAPAASSNKVELTFMVDK